MTGFTLTDALDLEEGEPPLTSQTLDKVMSYDRVSTAHRLFQEENRTYNAF